MTSRGKPTSQQFKKVPLSQRQNTSSCRRRARSRMTAVGSTPYAMCSASHPTLRPGGYDAWRLSNRCGMQWAVRPTTYAWLERQQTRLVHPRACCERGCEVELCCCCCRRCCRRLPPSAFRPCVCAPSLEHRCRYNQSDRSATKPLSEAALVLFFFFFPSRRRPRAPALGVAHWLPRCRCVSGLPI